MQHDFWKWDVDVRERITGSSGKPRFARESSWQDNDRCVLLPGLSTTAPRPRSLSKSNAHSVCERITSGHLNGNQLVILILKDRRPKYYMLIRLPNLKNPFRVAGGKTSRVRVDIIGCIPEFPGTLLAPISPFCNHVVDLFMSYLFHRLRTSAIFWTRRIP